MKVWRAALLIPYRLSATFLMVANWQNPSDTDVVLRASGGKEFHAHKFILSLASPTFKDMFSVPQPPPTESSQLPIVDVDDPPEALEIFLQIIYPNRNPLINNIETLVSILHLADKYNAEAIRDVHAYYLPPMYSNLPPVQMYAILCACGRERDAGAAARRVSFASLETLDSNPLLQFITTAQYQRLVSFMTVRDRKMRQIVNKHRAKIARSKSYSCKDTAHVLFSSILVGTLQAAFEADPSIQVVEALSLVSRAPCAFPQCGDNCRYNVAGLRDYAEGLLEELVEMVQNLPWEDPREEPDSDDDDDDDY